MSAFRSLLAPCLGGAALLLSITPAVQAQDLDAAPLIAQVELQAPVASPELEVALSALKGRPLQDEVMAEAVSLVEDFYAWLEWREVAVSVAAGATPGSLQFQVEAQPPLQAAAPPEGFEALPPPAEPAGARAEAPPTNYQGWVRSSARVLVDSRERRLYLKRGRRVVSYAVAVGTERTPTPPGVYRVVEIAHQPTWYPTPAIRRDHAARGIKLPLVVPPGADNPLGSWFVRLQNSIGIHGTNQPDSIGQASSWGCVRMHDRDLQELARALRPGDRVLVIGRPDEQQVSLN
ncbi:MAG TPA: L,D-transpeptidase [Solimonas sp.]|nr:L,D-transpeptidase [Solimonas sp.]